MTATSPLVVLAVILDFPSQVALPTGDFDEALCMLRSEISMLPTSIIPSQGGITPC